MTKESDGDYSFTGRLIDGPDIDLEALAGLTLTDDESDRIWGRISRRSLLIECLDCEEIELEEIEGGPGLSDSIYEYRCGDKADFVK